VTCNQLQTLTVNTAAVVFTPEHVMVTGVILFCLTTRNQTIPVTHEMAHSHDSQHIQKAAGNCKGALWLAITMTITAKLLPSVSCNVGSKAAASVPACWRLTAAELDRVQHVGCLHAVWPSPDRHLAQEAQLLLLLCLRILQTADVRTQQSTLQIWAPLLAGQMQHDTCTLLLMLYSLTGSPCRSTQAAQQQQQVQAFSDKPTQCRCAVQLLPTA
jgi:hypothetical protein